MIYNLSVIL